MRRELVLFVAVAGIILMFAIHSAHDSKVQSELRTLIELKSQNLEEELATLRAQTTNLTGFQKDTAAQLSQLIKGTQALSSWRVFEGGEGGKPEAEVLCQNGELTMALAQADTKTRALTLSAGGIRLQTAIRTLELSDRGIIIYENRDGERLGNVIWQTGFIGSNSVSLTR